MQTSLLPTHAPMDQGGTTQKRGSLQYLRDMIPTVPAMPPVRWSIPIKPAPPTVQAIWTRICPNKPPETTDGPDMEEVNQEVRQLVKDVEEQEVFDEIMENAEHAGDGVVEMIYDVFCDDNDALEGV